VRLRMPPLRERMEDLPVLIAELLRPLAKEMGRAVPKVSAHALKRLEGYPWPGNVRELRNVLERALITLKRDEIRNEDLLMESSAAIAPQSGGGMPAEEWEIQPLDDLIASYVAASVKATGGNVRKAARRLAISPSTLYARLKTKDGV
jgi:DNA-binding NtrC family response regulator